MLNSGFQLGSNAYSSKPEETQSFINQVTKQLKGFQKLEKLQGMKVEEDVENSIRWLVSPSGTKLRKICGHKSLYGPCLLSAGWGTEHQGHGMCSHHSRKSLYNVALSESYQIPARLGELLEHSEELEEKELSMVDTEIKLLYALQKYVMSMGPEMNLDQIGVVKDLAMDIVKSKGLKNKIQRELRLDTSSVKEFVEQIFGIIAKRVTGPEAKNLMNDILNEVIIPFRNKDRIKAGEMDPSAMKDKFLKKAENIIRDDDD